MFLLYSSLLALGLLLSAPWWLLQMVRQGKYRAGLRERLGILPLRVPRNDGQRPLIWIHAVSVGEALAVSGLVTRLRDHARVVVSTTTLTGQKLARERFGAENVFYFPLDLPFAIRPWLDALRPDLVVLAETEFWPNFIRLVARRKIPIVVGNARISDRSYPRYLRYSFLLRRVLTLVSRFVAQSEEDASRLREIGAPEDSVSVGGNLKFDVTPPSEHVAFVEGLRQSLGTDRPWPVVVAGSTVTDEEPLVLAAFYKVLAKWPQALLILAPRHRERFDDVGRIVVGSGMTQWRRSRLNGSEPLRGGVLLLDSIGELAAIYGLADLAFVGGSLVPRGGHNILEPAHFGVATIVGPYTENFRDIITLFHRQDAVAIAEDEELGDVMMRLLSNSSERAALGVRAQNLLRSQQGATERLAKVIEQLLGTGRSEPAARSLETRE